MFNITYREFLNVAMGGKVEDAWVCAVPSLNDGAGWYGGRFDTFEPVDHTDHNIYYSIARIKGSQKTGDNWAAGCVLALDDVGEKSGEAQLIRDAMGEPTAVVQTSAGSQQWIYALSEPVTDATLMHRLQRALTLKFYPNGKDPGHERIIQYQRLPGGHNDKQTRLDANGGIPQRVYLVEWRPERRITVDEAKAALAGAWEKTDSLTYTATGVTGPANEEQARGYLSHDPILVGLDMAGLVDWARITNGYVGVKCPWEAEHHVLDDRTGFNPDTQHFSCFHSSHGPKNAQDLHEWLRTTLGDKYKKVRHDMVVDAFRRAPLPIPGVDVDIDEEVAAAPDTWLIDITDMARRSRRHLPARKTICGHLARGETAYRVGEPMAGKSALALTYAAAIAWDRPDLVGEDKFMRAGDVVIVANEDEADQYEKRLDAWQSKHGLLTTPTHRILITPNTGEFRAFKRLDRWSEIDWGDGMAKLTAALSSLNNPCLVILDTQAPTFRGVEENSNGDMGTAMAMLGAWAKEHKVAVEIIHHMPKSNSQDRGGKMVSARGASSAVGAVRNMVTVVGLNDHQLTKLPRGEDGRAWVAEEGAKANHAALRDKKWFKKHIVHVTVSDPEMVDEHGNLLMIQEEMPVYVHDKKGPPLAFDARDPETMYRVLHKVAEAERDDAPFRVMKRRADAVDLADAVSDGTDWGRDDAKEAIKATADAGHIEVVPWRNPDTRKEVDTWSATKAGLDVIAARELPF